MADLSLMAFPKIVQERVVDGFVSRQFHIIEVMFQENEQSNDEGVKIAVVHVR